MEAIEKRFFRSGKEREVEVDSLAWMNELLFTSLSPQLPAVSERIDKQPECRLMWAVLQDAIDTYAKHVDAKRPRHRRLFREAEEWIEEDDPTWPFSFASICHTLGLDPDYLRNGLQHWKEHRNAEKGRESFEEGHVWKEQSSVGGRPRRRRRAEASAIHPVALQL